MIEVETEIPRGRELALPVTHGGAVEGEGVDVPDVGLGGPLLVQPGNNDGDGDGGGGGGHGVGQVGDGHGWHYLSFSPRPMSWKIGDLLAGLTS